MGKVDTWCTNLTPITRIYAAIVYNNYKRQENNNQVFPFFTIVIIPLLINLLNNKTT